jgi:mycofactocin system glycosyltransferase
VIERRYVLDDGVRRHDRVLIGGSPLKLFRLTDRGATVVGRIAAGDLVADSNLIAALLDAGAIHPVTGSGTRFTSADVTIVVPTLGPPGQSHPGAIVVDDGSAVAVAGAAVRLEPNRGPGAARNAGLALVETPLVAFVDADVLVPDGWLDRLLPHFDDERVAAVAPRVRSATGGSRIARYEVDHSPIDLGPAAARVHAGSRVAYVPAAAVVCRVDAVREIGGFDERLRFGEDVDLVWRLDAAGRRVRYEPASVVEHAPRPDWRSWARQRMDYGTSAAPLARRHPGALAPLRMSGWSVASWIAGVAAHPVLGAAISAGSAGALVRKLDDVPAREAFRLAWLGNLRAGEQIASAVRRVWWPLLLIAAARSRAARRMLVVSALAARHPVGLADDVAYSIGVWRGMLGERTIAPLIPEISSWPGRKTTGAQGV